jgi:uncharacterized membrane protein YsdA (DUF1294 family)
MPPAPQYPRRLSLIQLTMLLVLLTLPGLAIAQLTQFIPAVVIFPLLLLVSLLTWFACKFDKQWAQTGQRRIPEVRLHLLELSGGWPGSFLAQRRYRHKTRKFSYQVSFWLIILTWQVLAFESLSNWQLTRFFTSRSVGLASSIFTEPKEPTTHGMIITPSTDTPLHPR